MSSTSLHPRCFSSASGRHVRWPLFFLLLLSSILPGFGQSFLAEWTASANGGVGPTGMALATEAGTTYLYVSDHPRGRILKFNTATGAVVGTLGAQGSGNGQFSQPYGIAIEPVSGDLYVAERGNHRVQRITNTGTFVMAWGAQGAAQSQFNEPIGVAIDAAGDVYVTEHTNHRVQKFRVTQTGGTWSAAHVTMWGTQGSANGQFNTPYGIAADSAGNIWVADGFNSRVQRFNTSGVFQSAFGTAGSAPGQLGVPTWVTLDASGALHVASSNADPQNAGAADANNQWISKFAANGTFTSRFGGAHGTGPAQFRLPFSVVVGPNNRAYVADYYNNRVQVFDLAATPATGPAVASFVVAGSTATSVNFQLTFDRVVTGVDQADFTAVTTGGLAATIGAVTGTGATYTIPVTFTGTGTVQLTLKATGTGIADGSANALAVGANSATHTVAAPGGPDTTPPTIATFAAGTPAASSVNFALTFSEPVTGVNAADFSAATTGGATATIGTVTGSGATYTIPVAFTGTGTITLSLNATGSGIADAAGNAFAVGGAAPAFTIPASPGGGGGAQIVSVTVPANGTYEKNATLTFVVTFSGKVSVRTGDEEDDDDDEDDEDDARPFFTWTAAGSTGGKNASGKVTYLSGSGTEKLTFRYKVKNKDLAPKGIALGTSIQLPGGAAILDATGNSIPVTQLTVPWAQNPLAGVVIDAEKNSGPGNGNGNGQGKSTQIIILKPLSGLVVGEPITLTATSSSGMPVTFKLVSGNATLVGNVLTPKNKGAIVLRIEQGGSITFEPASLEVALEVREKHRNRLVNLSSRLRFANGDASRSAIAGFVVTGGKAKSILVRAIGPGLAGFGIRDALSGMRLQLRDAQGNLVAENDGWGNDSNVAAAGQRVGAFALLSGSRDSALVASLAPGAYTIQVTSSGNGITLLEVYDASTDGATAAEQLVNISSRGFVDTGDGQLVAGFVIDGDAPKRVLIRGIGPGLAAFGVANVVADPVLKIFGGNGASPIAQNDNWGATATAQAAQNAGTPEEIAAAASVAGAFPLVAGSRDAAMVVTLPPGSYSAVVSGANNGTGAGLVEVYELPTP